RRRDRLIVENALGEPNATELVQLFAKQGLLLDQFLQESCHRCRFYLFLRYPRGVLPRAAEKGELGSPLFFSACLISRSPSRDDIANPPVTELAANFSPMPQMATPPFGGLIAGGTGAEL